MAQKLYATVHHPKMHPQTKFWIPTLNNVRDMILSDPKLVRYALPSQDASTHQFRIQIIKEIWQVDGDLDNVVCEVVDDNNVLGRLMTWNILRW